MATQEGVVYGQLHLVSVQAQISWSLAPLVPVYQYGSTDAFRPYINRQAPPNTIDTAYVDGVSIPMGNLQDTTFGPLQVQL